MVYLGLSISKDGRSVAYATTEVQMAQNKQQIEDLRVRRTRKLARYVQPCVLQHEAQRAHQKAIPEMLPPA